MGIKLFLFCLVIKDLQKEQLHTVQLLLSLGTKLKRKEKKGSSLLYIQREFQGKKKERKV